MSLVTPTKSTTILTQSWGAQTISFGTMAFDNAGYAKDLGGDVITPAKFGLTQVNAMIIEPTAGYMLDYIESSGRVKVYLSAGGSGTTGATSGGTPAGTITGALDLAVAEFSGTGFVTAGQDITTTDNQTMAAVDTASGMWFIADGLASSPPVLILSNTIVVGAPAVLTCQGVPPVTDGGTYKIVTLGAATFAGSALATHTHTTAGGTAGEAPNGTDISAMTAVSYICIGR